MDETGATCVTNQLGTYAIIAEKIEPPVPYNEEPWLVATKLAGYGVSIILLIAFMVIIQLSAYLWEQFHIIRMNLAASLLLGSISSLLGEFQEVQEDRHLCTIVGCTIAYFYTAAACLLVAEAHACFKVHFETHMLTFFALQAITSGISGGRACVYLPLGWGVPFIALGHSVYTNLHDMGQVS